MYVTCYVVCLTVNSNARERLLHVICCIIFAACEMQNTCPQHSDCKNDGVTYKCECKKGFISVDGKCIGMENYLLK